MGSGIGTKVKRISHFYLRPFTFAIRYAILKLKYLIKSILFNLKEYKAMTNEMIEKLIDSMSDEELCAEVLSWEFDNKLSDEELAGVIKKNMASSIFVNNFSREQIRFAKGVIKESVSSPCLVTADVEAGPILYPEITPFVPSMMTYGATNNEKLVYEIGKYTARLSRAQGIHMTFSPVVDINLNFNTPVLNTRTASDDADRVLRIAGAYARGIESEGKLAATLKHFPGDGVDDRNQHFCTSVNSLSREEWDATYGKIYKSLINDGISAVMVGHIALPCYDDTVDECGYMPATLSKKLMTDLLRDNLGFKGCIVSDAMCMIGTATRVPIERLAVEFLRAGGDLVLFPERDDFGRVLAALKNGYLPRERLVDAVRHVVELKNKLGLYENDVSVVDPADESALRDLLVQAAEESITLIRNFDGVIPMKLRPGARILSITLGLDPYNRDERILIPTFDDELRQRGYEVISMLNPKHYDIDKVIEDVDAAFVIINVNSMQCTGASLRLGWSSMMAFWRAYMFKNKNVATISFGDPYKIFELPFLRTYVNAYAPSDSTVRTAIRACLGELEFKGKSPVRLEGFFEREE